MRRPGRPGAHHPSLAGPAHFGLTAFTATLTFIFAFGLVKAGANLAAGALMDRFGRRPVLLAGISVVGVSAGFGGWALGMTLLGIGTSMVYPTLLAAIGDVAQPRLACLRPGRVPVLA
jgi:MFS family permease